MDVVLDGCKPESLAALVQTSCDFIDDFTRVTITRQLPSVTATDQPGAKPSPAAAAAAEKPDDSAASAPVDRPSAGSDSDLVKPSIGSTVEDKVCISGAVSLKVHVEYVYVCM